MDSIIVFGRGKVFERFKHELLSRYRITCFIDNAVPESDIFSVNGVEYNVYNPGKLECLPDDNILVVINSFIPVWKQLRSLGIDEKRMMFRFEIPNYVSELIGEGYSCSSLNDRLHFEYSGGCIDFENETELEEGFRSIFNRNHPNIETVNKLDLTPSSRTFGFERGMAVDRVYIERFLRKYKDDIRGVVLEVAEPLYTRKFGGKNVTREIVIHLKGWGENVIQANIETGEGLEEESVDCIICTQVLQYIFDLKEAIRNIYKTLKKGGVALITVPGIKSISLGDDNEWDDYWSFTKKTIERLCAEVSDDYTAYAYGNAKVSAAYLYGLCAEDMSEDVFLYDDYQFPFLVCVRIRK